MAQLFETLCMMLAFKESHSLAMHYCRLVWDVRSLSSLDVNCEPWSECKIRFLLTVACASNAFFTVRIARLLVMFLSVMLDTTLRSCKSITEQLYRTLPSFKKI